MVGRDDEMREIEAAWSRVTEGNRETVVVAGEPGAGKSRLIAEAAHAAHASGGLVLYGSGEGDSETPYAPFVTALARLERQAPAALLQEMRRSSLGALIREAGSPTRENWSLGDDRARLFAASLEMLELLARHGPLLLAVDDLHACQASTLALATHLTRAAAGAPVLLVTTYRPTDVEPDGEVMETVGTLSAPTNARHLELKALSATALREPRRLAGDRPGGDARPRRRRRRPRERRQRALRLRAAAGDRRRRADQPPARPRPPLPTNSDRGPRARPRRQRPRTPLGCRGTRPRVRDDGADRRAGTEPTAVETH